MAAMASSSLFGGMGGMKRGGGEIWGSPAAKRTRPDAKAVTDKDPDRQDLISSIKAYQKQDEASKQKWWAFCMSKEGGNKDPARHSSDVLSEFLMSSEWM